MNYRAEIDGLRAIAVLSVILYHAEIMVFGRDWFEGGFIGVDIFFVISGYLISRIILSELFEKGSFSFLNFYERRARRILPMLFTVMLVSIPFAWQILLPMAFVEYSKSIISAVFFSSNFFFYFATTAYGTDSALLQPFLHTWSLGIEEQFYIVFPLLLLLFYKFLRDYLLTLLLALLLLSLQFSEVMGVRNPELNYYLPMSRFWELLVGSVLAYFELRYGRIQNSLAAQALPILGLCLISYSILFFDPRTPHPSFTTAIPIVGVALVIAFSSAKDLSGKVLGSIPFVGIGLISYSAYLWHFPVFAFSRLDNSTPSNYDKIEWIVLTLILSVVSFYLIETPFRKRSVLSLKAVTVSCSAALGLIVSVSLLSVDENGFPNRFDNLAGFLIYERDNKKLQSETWSNVNQKREFQRGDATKVLLVGNSHSKDIFNAFNQNSDLYKDFDFLNYGIETNHIQISCFDESNKDNADIADRFFGSASYRLADIIVISTHYSEGQCRKRKRHLKKSNDLDGLPYLIERALNDRKKVVVFGNATDFRIIDRKTIADAFILEEERTGQLSRILVDKYAYDAFRARINSEYFKRKDRKRPLNDRVMKIAQELDVPYIDKFEVVCEDSENVCFGLTPNGHKSFFDNDHFTMEGAKFFGERMAHKGVLDLLNRLSLRN